MICYLNLAKKGGDILESTDINIYNLKQNRHENKVFHKAKLMLRIYRDVVWSIDESVNEMEARCYDLGGMRLKETLDVLDDFDTTINCKELEARLCCALKSKCLIEIVDKALLKVKNYPEQGEEYFNIIYLQYINKKAYSEKDILENMHFERTTFYKKKKAAINLLGIALWGYIIPSLKEVYNVKSEIKVN